MKASKRYAREIIRIEKTKTFVNPFKTAQKKGTVVLKAKTTLLKKRKKDERRLKGNDEES